MALAAFFSVLSLT